MNLNIYFIFVAIFTLFLEMLLDNIVFRVAIMFILGFLLGREMYQEKE